MNTIVALIIMALINCAAIWLSHYFGRSGHNAAEKEDIKEITYLSESGKNLATKEDIEDITKKIEIIKNEISFENQRKHQFIEERTNRLLKILRCAENLHVQQIQLGYLLHDETNLCNLTTIIKEINNEVADLAHECRMIAVTMNDKELIKSAYNLLHKSEIYGNSFCKYGCLHLALLHSLHARLELFKSTGEDGLTKGFSEIREEIEKNKVEFAEEIKPYRDDQYKATIIYMNILAKLYKKDFHLRFEYELQKEDISPTN